jgi:hypothetical protein
LFGALRRSLSGEVFTDEEKLRETVTDWLNDLSQKELRGVFENWITRCEFVEETGQYFLKGKKRV